MKHYIIGIDFGDGETSANIIEINIDGKNTSCKDILPAKITGLQNRISSTVCFSPFYKTWIISPEPTDIHECLSADSLNFKFGAYFKIHLSKFLVAIKTKFTSSGVLNKNAVLDFFKQLAGLDDSSFLDFLHKQGINYDNEESNISTLYYIKFVQQVYNKIYINNGLSEINGDRNYTLYAACPTGWSDSLDSDNSLQIQTIYMLFLNSIGIPCEDVIEESRAAFISCRKSFLKNQVCESENKGILVIDFGSSTVDLTWYQGDSSYHTGIPLGAQFVEKAIYYYMYGNEEKAKKAYNEWKQYFDDASDLETLVNIGLRQKKESFFNSIDRKPNPRLSRLSAEQIFGEEFLDKLHEDAFGFDETPCQYDITKVLSIINCGKSEFRNEKVLDECIFYREKIKTAYSEVKSIIEKDKKGTIDHVILTGGASNMKFIHSDIQEIFHVSEPETLEWEKDCSCSVSKGIVQHGVFHYYTKDTIDKIVNIIKNEWLNNINLESKVEAIIKQILRDKYKNAFLGILKKWEEREIVLSPLWTLNSFLDQIVAVEKTDVWNKIGIGKNLYLDDRNASLHALFRKLFDYIDNESGETSIESISNDLNSAFALEVSNQLTEEYAKYWRVFYPDKEYEDVVKLNLPFNIKISFSAEYKIELIKKLIENSVAVVNNDVVGFNEHSLNRNRNKSVDFCVAGRIEFSKCFTSILEEFALKLNPTINTRVVVNSYREQIKQSFITLQRKCLNNISNSTFDLKIENDNE